VPAAAPVVTPPAAAPEAAAASLDKATIKSLANDIKAISTKAIETLKIPDTDIDEDGREALYAATTGLTEKIKQLQPAADKDTEARGAISLANKRIEEIEGKLKKLTDLPTVNRNLSTVEKNLITTKANISSAAADKKYVEAQKLLPWIRTVDNQLSRLKRMTQTGDVKEATSRANSLKGEMNTIIADNPATPVVTPPAATPTAPVVTPPAAEAGKVMLHGFEVSEDMFKNDDAAEVSRKLGELSDDEIKNNKYPIVKALHDRANAEKDDAQKTLIQAELKEVNKIK